jgi:hypothetical protein
VCETWPLTLRAIQKLSVFKNTVLRRIFGPVREGIPRGRRKLYNEELQNLYSSPTIRAIKSRIVRWKRCKTQTKF